MKTTLITSLVSALLIPLYVSAARPAVVVDEIVCTPQPFYRYSDKGEPCRAADITIRGHNLTGKTDISVIHDGKSYRIPVKLSGDTLFSGEILLPSQMPVGSPADIRLSLGSTHTDVSIPPMRHWTVYLYNHSHVDIGYTNTHKNVEHLHVSNVREGMRLARETSSLRPGARYVWNPEVTWPVERLWESDPDARLEIIEAIRKGHLAIDASYVNLNTSILSDEEMFHAFDFSRRMQQLSGVPSDVFQQFDIPGMSWGLVPVMAHRGIKYVISWPNTDRGGVAHSNGIDGYPFWWVGPDGKSKVLFLQPGTYANSGSMGKGSTTGRPWFGQRDHRKVPARISTGDANVDFTSRLSELEASGYPYDILALSWTLWDNCPLDADVPYAVDRWNATHAYPKIIIAGGHEIMSDIEHRYGDSLPVVSGDYTEYWTDGLGSAARLTAMNRRSKNRLTQAETAWSVLSGLDEAPRDEMDRAWHDIMMGSEHTWDFENPYEPYFHEALFKSKEAYFNTAQASSQLLLDESLGLIADKSNGALGPKAGPANGGIAVINAHSWPSRSLITLSKKESQHGDRIIAADGRILPSQRLSDGSLVFLTDTVAPLSTAHYRNVEGPASGGSMSNRSTDRIANSLISADIDTTTGNITSLTINGDTYNYIDTSDADHGANNCAWLPANVDEPRADSVISIEFAENGPLLTTVRITSAMTGCRSVTRTVTIVDSLPWISIDNEVDKLPLEAKDGIHFGFPFNIANPICRVDIPWGVMQMEKDQWPQACRNWTAMQHWVDITDGNRGVTWCSLDAPLFEYGARTANISYGWGGQGPWNTAYTPSARLYSWVMNNHWHTNFPLTQDGPARFAYAIMPHMGDNIPAANRFGIEQSQPMVHVTTDNDPAIKPIFTLDNDAVYATIVKPHADAGTVTVRLRSVSPHTEDVYLSFPTRTPTGVQLIPAEQSAPVSIDNTLQLPPYGMATLQLFFN
ncbi:MAG: glycosyl hydrolase [Muribaculum sp.]|nr:glycosyl hydrolase [Muribaculum sp.]